MKRTIEIEDTLQERIDGAINGVRDALREYLVEKPETTELPDLNSNLDYSGGIHEIIDSSVPIYTHEIKSAMFLYGSKIESAFDDAGIGSREDYVEGLGWEGAAIYCYIETQVQEWYGGEEPQVLFEKWRGEQDAREQEEAEARDNSAEV